MFKKIVLLCILLQSAFVSHSHANLNSTPPPKFPLYFLPLLQNERIIRKVLQTEKEIYAEIYKNAAQAIHADFLDKQAAQIFDTALTNFDQAQERFQLFESLGAIVEDLLHAHKRMERDYKDGLPYNPRDVAQIPQLNQEFSQYWGEFLQACHGWIIPQEILASFNLE